MIALWRVCFGESVSVLGVAAARPRHTVGSATSLDDVTVALHERVVMCVVL
jgi:hypothetical protein